MSQRDNYSLENLWRRLVRMNKAFDRQGREEKPRRTLKQPPGTPALQLFRDAVLFVLRTKHAVDRVGSAMAGFVVVTDLHLAEQADGEQIQSAEQQAESQHHQRAVRSHYRNVAQELLHSQPGYDGAAAEQAKQAEGAEEVQRTRKIAEQEANGDEIEKDAEGAGNAVVRSAALAVYVAYGHFAN